MNNLIAMSPEMTMGTREIAEMLGKRHDNIKASAKKMAESGVILTPSEQGFSHNGNEYTELRLNKRDSIILVAQNSPEFTARLVDRWAELETKTAKIALPDFNDPVASARAWANAKENEQVALQQLAIAAPKVEFVDRHVESTGNLGFRQVAKLLKVK